MFYGFFPEDWPHMMPPRGAKTQLGTRTQGQSESWGTPNPMCHLCSYLLAIPEMGQILAKAKKQGDSFESASSQVNCLLKQKYQRW